MFELKGSEDWVQYMSPKRRHIKKQNQLNMRVGKLIKKDMKKTNDGMKMQKLIKR